MKLAEIVTVAEAVHERADARGESTIGGAVLKSRTDVDMALLANLLCELAAYAALLETRLANLESVVVP